MDDLCVGIRIPLASVQYRMDPLSEVLSLLKPQSYRSGGMDMGSAWSARFGRHDGIKCYALVSGECWLAVEGVDAPVKLTEGDCFLLPSGQPFQMASDLSLEPVDAVSSVQMPLNGAIWKMNGGGSCFIIGGHFAVSGEARVLLDVLPPIVHLSSPEDRAAMRWSIERMMQELREPKPGSALIAQQMAQVLLVEALRLHLAEGAGVGWLFALADPQMSAALSAMHDDPAQHWTLERLAKSARMSRSSFAARFKETVGVAPMEYLTRWRMLLASERLRNSRDSVAEIALSLGYESESAFSTAFKRVMGRSPRQFGRGGGLKVAA